MISLFCSLGDHALNPHTIFYFQQGHTDVSQDVTLEELTILLNKKEKTYDYELAKAILLNFKHLF